MGALRFLSPIRSHVCALMPAGSADHLRLKAFLGQTLVETIHVDDVFIVWHLTHITFRDPVLARMFARSIAGPGLAFSGFRLPTSTPLAAMNDLYQFDAIVQPT